jgi:hypothetical protein
MSYSQRSPAPRFSNGSLVEIRDVISTRYFGQTGTVVVVRPSRRNRTLDKYVVRFASGVEKVFWNIQLREVPKSQNWINLSRSATKRTYTHKELKLPPDPRKETRQTRFCRTLSYAQIQTW